MSERVFQRGETVDVWAYTKDWVGTYVTPSSGVKLTITTPTGITKVDAASMTEISTGHYVYYYDSVSDDTIGWWKCKAVATDGTRVTITLGGFQLQGV